MSFSSTPTTNGKNQKLKINSSNQEKKEKNRIHSALIKKDKLIEPQHTEGTNSIFKIILCIISYFLL